MPAEPSFTITKEQKIEGEGAYADGENTGKTGQKVEYKITVKNTGNVTLKFGALKDTGCEGISPSGATELAAGAKSLHLHAQTVCGRLLHQRSLDRRQRRHRHQDLQQSHRQSQRRTVLHDREAAADRRRRLLQPAENTGKPGQTVEYKVIVRNTGNVAIKFSALKDTGCEGISPSGATELAAGAEEIFTCSHKLAAVGTYSNEASIEGNEGTGTKTSNKVTATSPPNRPTRSKSSRARGESPTGWPKRPAPPASWSNTRSSSRTPATCRSNSAP